MAEPLNGAEFVGTLYNMRLCDVVGYGYDLGLASYPIWDEDRRHWLNERIIEHFYMREISAETPALFIFYLNRKMNEVMPWLNTVFESNATLKDHEALLNNEEIRVERTASGQSHGDASSVGDSKGRAYTSQDPTVSMVGRDEVRYFDQGSHSDTSTQGATSNDARYANADTEHRKGHYGRTLTGAVTEYMESYSNSLELLFEELEPLFCQVLDVPGMRFEDAPRVWGFGPWGGFYAGW